MKKLRFKRKYFLMIQSDGKTLECRVNYPSLRKIRKGDQIKFFWESLSEIVEIIDIREYQSFRTMLNNENVAKLVPGMSKSQALAEYEAIYSKQKVAENDGIVILEFKIICE